MASAGSLEAQWRAQASQLLGAALAELQLTQAALAGQRTLRSSGASRGPFTEAAYMLSDLLAAGQTVQGPYTPQEFCNYCPSAAAAAWFLGEAEELLAALDEASAFCSSALEELDGNGSEGPHSWSGILLKHTLEISELATAAAKVESSVLTLCITTQPAGAAARKSVANCARSLVTCFGAAARALETAHKTGAFQQVFPFARMSVLMRALFGPVSTACKEHSPLRAVTRSQLDAQASNLIAGMCRCANLLASPDYLRAHDEQGDDAPGAAAHNLWQIYAELLFTLVEQRAAVFPGVWNALRADKACARALLAACAHFHSTITASPMEEFQGQRWGELWSSTAGCATVLSDAATDAASLDFVHTPVRRELFAMLARLERLLGMAPSIFLLDWQAACCNLLIVDAQRRCEAWQAERGAGQGQPHLPLEVLESLAAGASGLVTVLAITAWGGPLPSMEGHQQASDSELHMTAVALLNMLPVCDTAIDALLGGATCFIGPAPLAAAKVAEACVRLAAVLPQWLAVVQCAGTRAVLANLSLHAPQLLAALVGFAQGLESGTANAICLEGRVPNPMLSTAVYNCAVSAVKVVNGWLGQPASSPAWALLSRVPDRTLSCLMVLKTTFILAHKACQREQFSRDMLALTARVSSAVVKLTDPSIVPAEIRVELASMLCHVLWVLGDERAEYTQCAVLAGVAEAVAGAVARALGPEPCGGAASADEVAAFVATCQSTATGFLNNCPWMAVSLVDAGAVEGLARWTSHQLRRPARQRSEAAKGGVTAAAPIFVVVLCALGDLLAEREPRGVSAAARAAVRRKSFEQLVSEWGRNWWESAAHWDVQIRRRLLPLMREAAAGLMQQAEAAGGLGPLSAEEAEALQQRIAAALAEGRSCANPACGQCRGASEARERLKRCSRCGVAAFCSPACLRQAWPQHRRVCRPRV